MFQVASHPTSFDAVRAHSRRETTHASSVQSSAAVQLPRALARPHPINVSPNAILAVAPELANVPSEYIRRRLRPQAHAMLSGLSAVNLPGQLHRSQVTGVISVPLRPSASSMAPTYPTHVLAISTSKASPDTPCSMFPIHGVVIASQCAKLPCLPPSQSRAPAGSVNLPVLPLSLPSVAAFSIIHSYMYTHRLDGVLKSLFPMPTGFLDSVSQETVRATLHSGTTLHQLASFLCASASGNPQTLMSHAAHVKELWQDAVALGLHDPELWDTIDLAWEVVLRSLNLAAA